MITSAEVTPGFNYLRGILVGSVYVNRTNLQEAGFTGHDGSWSGIKLMGIDAAGDAKNTSVERVPHFVHF